MANKTKKQKQKTLTPLQKEQQRNNHLFKTYGITLTEWRMMYESQGRVCKICKTLPGSGRLCVDHLHIKGFKKSDSIENFYDIEATIGQGSFGEVFKAKHLLTN